MDFFELNLAKKLAENENSGGSIPTIELTLWNDTGDYLELPSFNGQTFDQTMILNGEIKKITDLYITFSNSACMPSNYQFYALKSATDCVNCSFEDGLIFITDPTKNASASVTYRSDEH